MQPKKPRLFIARTKNQHSPADPEWELLVASYSSERFCNKHHLTTIFTSTSHSLVQNYQEVPTIVSQTDNYIVVVCVAKIVDYARFRSILKDQSTLEKVRTISSRIWVQRILKALSEDVDVLGTKVTAWETVETKTIEFTHRMIQRGAESDLSRGGSVPLCDLLTGHEKTFQKP